MSYSIIWSPDAITSFEDRIAYLTIHFTNREINNFKERVREYLFHLADEPLIGRPAKFPYTRVGLIIKQVSLVYRLKKAANEIELVLFFDNRQDPQKLKKYTG